MSGPPAELRTRLIQAAYEAAVADGRYEAPTARRAPARARLYRDGRLTLLAPYFDYEHYAFETPDFAASGLDELEHFDFFGWRRLRNPAAWFDTGYYLSSNPDVLASGDNPFWHYILKGRAEGRAPRRPRGAERAILDNLAAPEARRAPPRGLGGPRLSADDLAARLAPRLERAKGFVLCFDAFPPGNEAEDWLQAERADFTERGYAHLRATPARGGPTLRAMPASWSDAYLELDGEGVGVAADSAVAQAFAALRDAMPAARALVVHGVAGASVEGLLGVEAALAPQRRLFWLHDFSSLCTSARLLRNDVAFCGAPPPSSQACRVCIHGEARRAHLTAMARLFDRDGFTVVAPSAGALALWRRATELPFAETRVRALASLNGAASVVEREERTAPLRVAYLGAPSLADGWLTFERILEACGELSAYEFHHIAAPQDLRPSRNLVSVAAQAPQRRDALIRVDLALAPREGPETFSQAALDALAAGCDLLTLAHSGHAAELAEGARRGRAFASDDDLVEFFVDGRALAYARERERFGRHVQQVRRQAGSAAEID